MKIQISKSDWRLCKDWNSRVILQDVLTHYGGKGSPGFSHRVSFSGFPEKHEGDFLSIF